MSRRVSENAGCEREAWCPACAAALGGEGVSLEGMCPWESAFGPHRLASSPVCVRLCLHMSSHLALLLLYLHLLIKSSPPLSQINFPVSRFLLGVGCSNDKYHIVDLGDGVSGGNSVGCRSMRTCVHIPSTHKKIWVCMLCPKHWVGRW